MSEFEVHVIECHTDPVGAPPDVGMHWINTVTCEIWFSCGTNTIDDWLPLEQGIIKSMDCTAIEAVGDLVYQSLSTNGLAVKAIDNTNLSPIVGQIIFKPTTLTCRVQLKGIVPVAIARGRVWLGATGTYTTSAPISGYVQNLGWSCGDGRVEINPEMRRTKRS